MTLWESDQSIVPKKPRNGGGGKELAGMQPVCVPACASTADRQRTGRWDLRDTIARHGTGARLSTKLKSLAQRARRSPKYKFIALAHLLTEDFLLECFKELKGGKAPGINGIR